MIKQNDQSPHVVGFLFSVEKMAARMEILDIAYVHGWATVAKYLERTSTSGNKELRLAIEDVKREEALGLKRTTRRSRSSSSPMRKRSSAGSAAAGAGPQDVAHHPVHPTNPGAWMQPPGPPQGYNPYPPPQPYPGYGAHRTQTPRERMAGNCFRCGEQGHLIKACPRKLAPM